MGKPISKYPDRIEHVICATDGTLWMRLVALPHPPSPEQVRAVVGRSTGTRLRLGLEPITKVRIDRVETYRGQVEALHPTSIGDENG